MNKLQGSLIILICVVIGFSQLGAVLASILSKDTQLIRILISTGVLVLSGFGIKRGVQLFRNTKTTEDKPASAGDIVALKIGNAFLVLSVVSVVATIGLIIYLAVTKSAGVPAGFGFAIALILFVVGQGVKGIASKNS